MSVGIYVAEFPVAIPVADWNVSDNLGETTRVIGLETSLVAGSGTLIVTFKRYDGAAWRPILTFRSDSSTEPWRRRIDFTHPLPAIATAIDHNSGSPQEMSSWQLGLDIDWALFTDANVSLIYTTDRG